MTDEWIAGSSNTHTMPQTGTWHLNGVSWYDAPLPPRRHTCTAQTRGLLNFFTEVERCSCGAIRYGDWAAHDWLRRNERQSEPPPRKRRWRRGR